ncbi:hypothetical protein ACTFIW_007506 [Dictyostelium discoideum]
MSVRENLLVIIKSVQENRFLEAFEIYYDNNVVMYEKGDSTNRVGKEANRKAEESFLNNVSIHETKITKILVDGNNSAYEMYMNFTYDGYQVAETQWALQEWKNGKVTKEEFY